MHGSWRAYGAAQCGSRRMRAPRPCCARWVARSASHFLPPCAQRYCCRPSRHLRLEPPDPGDWRYIESTMAREARKLGAPGVYREGAALLFNLPPAPPAASNLEE